MSTTIDQQFVEYVVKTIVSNPDAVSIMRTIDEKGVLLELTVDQQDLGRVIGKRGSGAQALRTLLRALGTKNDARYNLKIVDVGDGEDRPAREDKKPTHKKEDNEEKPQKEDKLEEPVVEEKSEEENKAEEKNDQQSSFEKTRRELADLDDLDI